MKEMRTLGFTEREAIQAIIDLMRKQRLELPVGQVVGLELHEDPVSAELIIEDDDGKRTHLTRNAAELAASLVNYCIGRKIRLPSMSNKFVEVIAGSLNLIIYLDNVESAATKKMTRRA
ncbi:hypothetical protein [Niveispirillum cyanobacteriorum]|nr:hypothetical protein [Niveispirillum cyanobacteriorum]GGE73805.1 hypothetical protein GCM10011317_33670 [Niveispirillum cyanobacteriorum]